MVLLARLQALVPGFRGQISHSLNAEQSPWSCKKILVSKTFKNHPKPFLEKNTSEINVKSQIISTYSGWVPRFDLNSKDYGIWLWLGKLQLQCAWSCLATLQSTPKPWIILHKVPDFCVPIHSIGPPFVEPCRATGRQLHWQSWCIGLKPSLLQKILGCGMGPWNLWNQILPFSTVISQVYWCKINLHAPSCSMQKSLKKLVHFLSGVCRCSHLGGFRWQLGSVQQGHLPVLVSNSCGAMVGIHWGMMDVGIHGFVVHCFSWVSSFSAPWRIYNMSKCLLDKPMFGGRWQQSIQQQGLILPTSTSPANLNTNKTPWTFCHQQVLRSQAEFV